MPRCGRCAEPLNAASAFCSPACQFAAPIPKRPVLLLIPLSLLPLLKTPTLRREMVTPVLLTLAVLMIGLGTGFYQLARLFRIWLSTHGPAWQGFALPLALLPGALLSMLLFLPLASLISIPFLEQLSQRGEDLLLHKPRPEAVAGLPWRVWWRELLGLLGLKIVIMLLGLPLLLVPLVGPVCYLWLLSALTAFDSLDLVLSRKGFRLAEKGHFVRQHGTQLLLFSLPLLLMSWVPLLQLLLLPAATLAAVELFLRCQARTAARES